jgi:hypothetical protein
VSTNQVDPFRHADGTLKLPESTLGQLRAFSVRRPKSMLDVGLGSSPTPAPSGGDEAATIEPSAHAASYASIPARTSMFASKALAYLIEEGLRLVMDIDDIDSILISLGPQHPMENSEAVAERARLRQQRDELCLRVLEALDLELAPTVTLADGSTRSEVYAVADDHLLYQFGAIKKGRLFIYRALAVLPPSHTFVVLHNVLRQAAMFAYVEGRVNGDG